VAVQFVAAQVVGGEQVTNAVRAFVGRPSPAAGRPSALAAGGGPLLAGVWLQVQRPELVDADHHRRVAIAGLSLAVGEVIQLQDAVLFGLEVRVVGLLPGLYRLKRHALLAEQNPQALMADVVDHPLSDEEVRRHVTTDPELRRTMRSNRLPSSLLMSRTRTRSATAPPGGSSGKDSRRHATTKPQIPAGATTISRRERSRLRH